MPHVVLGAQRAQLEIFPWLDDSQTFDPPTLCVAVSPSFRIAAFVDICQLH
jgi:hypothetical protein